jgi:hypothetical protein
MPPIRAVMGVGRWARRRAMLDPVSRKNRSEKAQESDSLDAMDIPTKCLRRARAVASLTSATLCLAGCAGGNDMASASDASGPGTWQTGSPDGSGSSSDAGRTDSGGDGGSTGTRRDGGNADSGTDSGSMGGTSADAGNADGGSDTGGADAESDSGSTSTASTAALASAAWNSAFLEQNSGHPYYANEETSVGDTVARMYTGALDIAVAEDVYQQTHGQGQRDLIASLIDTYLLDNVATSSGTQGENGTDWSYDGWNDDIGWMTNAVLRGYQYTGVARYLSVAENNWNMGYDRGWDGTLGGGIWENNMPSAGKQALSNNPFVWEGVTLYQLTGDATYLTKAEAIYSWVRTNLVNTTNGDNNLGKPGQVNQGINQDGTLSASDNVYNEGAFVAAAAALYRVTGTQGYYDDAVRTITHVINGQPILKNNQEHCGCQWAYWFTYGLGQFATEANLWPQYLSYLQKNADAAWSERNARNLTWNDWTAPTNNSVSPSDPDEVEMESAVAIWQHLPPPGVVLSGTYEIQNVASGLAMTVAANSTTNGAAIVQSPFTVGATSALWTFVPTSGGYYQIKNASSGLVVNVSGGSVANGAPIVEWLAQGMIPGNDQWLPVQNSNGTYSFYNLDSLQALDVPGASTASGTQLDQWFGNGSDAQAFRLVPEP